MTDCDTVPTCPAMFDSSEDDRAGGLTVPVKVAITLDTYSQVTHALAAKAVTRIARTSFGASDAAAVDTVGPEWRI